MGTPSRGMGVPVELDGNYLSIDSALIGVILGCEADEKRQYASFRQGYAPNNAALPSRSGKQSISLGDGSSSNSRRRGARIEVSR